MADALTPRACMALILWLRGHSLPSVAKAVNWPPNRVHHLVYRRRPLRHELTLEQRQAEIERLRPHAPPNLPELLFVAGEIAHPRPQAKCEEDLDETTREGRRKARRLRAQEAATKRAEEKARESRELGLAKRRGRVSGERGSVTMSSALEHLLDTRLLRDRGDRDQSDKSSEEQRRLEAGIRLRNHFDAIRIGGLGAVDYERATMGGGSSGQRTLSGWRLEFIHSLGTLRQMLPPIEFAIIEAVVDRDEFIWEREKPNSRARATIYEAIRYGLDVVAVHQLLMEREAFKARWGEDLPNVERVNRADTAAQAQAVAALMEQARG